MSKLTCRELLAHTAIANQPWDELADRVERVLALHRPVTSPNAIGGGPVLCAVCIHGSGPLSASWPCPTVRLLNGEEP